MVLFRKVALTLMMMIFALAMLFPILITFSNSLMTESEID